MIRRLLTVLLCGYLLLWIPLGIANEVLITLPSLDMRGAPALAELAFHLLVGILCATAGWMLVVHAADARAAAALAVVASAATSLQSLFWTALPRQTAPGQRLPGTLLVVAHALFWLLTIRGGHVGPREEPA